MEYGAELGNACLAGVTLCCCKEHGSAVNSAPVAPELFEGEDATSAIDIWYADNERVALESSLLIADGRRLIVLNGMLLQC